MPACELTWADGYHDAEASPMWHVRLGESRLAAMSINPYDSPETASQPPERKPAKARFTLAELLVVIGVIGVLIGLLLPNMRRSGVSAARRMSCQNHLKQIAIALLNYQDVYHSLPPAYTVDASGKPLHSWRTLILPYLEPRALYEKIDL